MPDFQITHSQTVPGLGAGQGVMVYDEKVYLYGDAETGVIREYDLKVVADKPELIYSGLEIKLTYQGKDICPHPTGLTVHPEYGCFIGNTVSGKGTIFHVDWALLKQDRHLDRALKSTAIDDVAVNGVDQNLLEWGKDGLSQLPITGIRKMQCDFTIP